MATSWGVDRAPAGLGGFDEFEDRRHAGGAGAGGPLVTRMRSLTVAKVETILVTAWATSPVLGREGVAGLTAGGWFSAL
jgi:hypothetical protein